MCSDWNVNIRDWAVSEGGHWVLMLCCAYLFRLLLQYLKSILFYFILFYFILFDVIGYFILFDVIGYFILFYFILLSYTFIRIRNRIRAQNNSKNAPNTTFKIDFKQFKLKTKQWLLFPLYHSISYPLFGTNSDFLFWLIPQ